MAGSASAISGRRADSGTVPRACRPSSKICSYEVQVQVQVEPRADLRHFKQRGTKPGGNGGGRHQLRNSAVRDRDGGQGRERGRAAGEREAEREAGAIVKISQPGRRQPARRPALPTAQA